MKKRRLISHQCRIRCNNSLNQSKWLDLHQLLVLDQCWTRLSRITKLRWFVLLQLVSRTLNNSNKRWIHLLWLIIRCNNSHSKRDRKKLCNKIKGLCHLLMLMLMLNRIRVKSIRDQDLDSHLHLMLI